MDVSRLDISRSSSCAEKACVHRSTALYFECQEMYCKEALALGRTMSSMESNHHAHLSMVENEKSLRGGLFPFLTLVDDPWEIFACITEYTQSELSFHSDIL